MRSCSQLQSVAERINIFSSAPTPKISPHFIDLRVEGRRSLPTTSLYQNISIVEIELKSFGTRSRPHQMVAGVRGKRQNRGSRSYLLDVHNYNNVLKNELTLLNFYTGSSRIKGAKFGDPCSVMADWLTMGWPFCQADFKRFTCLERLFGT